MDFFPPLIKFCFKHNNNTSSSYDDISMNKKYDKITDIELANNITCKKVRNLSTIYRYFRLINLMMSG